MTTLFEAMKEKGLNLIKRGPWNNPKPQPKELLINGHTLEQGPNHVGEEVYVIEGKYTYIYGPDSTTYSEEKFGTVITNRIPKQVLTKNLHLYLPEYDEAIHGESEADTVDEDTSEESE